MGPHLTNPGRIAAEDHVKLLFTRRNRHRQHVPKWSPPGVVIPCKLRQSSAVSTPAKSTENHSGSITREPDMILDSAAASLSHAVAVIADADGRGGVTVNFGMLATRDTVRTVQGRHRNPRNGWIEIGLTNHYLQLDCTCYKLEFDRVKRAISSASSHATLS